MGEEAREGWGRGGEGRRRNRRGCAPGEKRSGSTDTWTYVRTVVHRCFPNVGAVGGRGGKEEGGAQGGRAVRWEAAEWKGSRCARCPPRRCGPGGADCFQISVHGVFEKPKDAPVAAYTVRPPGGDDAASRGATRGRTGTACGRRGVGSGRWWAGPAPGSCVRPTQEPWLTLGAAALWMGEQTPSRTPTRGRPARSALVTAPLSHPHRLPAVLTRVCFGSLFFQPTPPAPGSDQRRVTHARRGLPSRRHQRPKRKGRPRSTDADAAPGTHPRKSP